MDDKRSEIHLRKQYKGEFLVFFRNFVEGYFIPSYDYGDLPMLINRYKDKEPSEKKNGLLRELKLLKEKDDWYYIQNFIDKHGMRRLSHEKLKKMFDILIEVLESNE